MWRRPDDRLDLLGADDYTILYGEDYRNTKMILLQSGRDSISQSNSGRTDGIACYPKPHETPAKSAQKEELVTEYGYTVLYEELAEGGYQVFVPSRRAG